MGDDTETLTLAPFTSDSMGPFHPLPLVASEHYTVLGVHAQGGLGRVLRAFDHRGDRIVAIKELLRRDRVAELRFMREIALTNRLRHPCVVPLYEAGRWSNGTLFYAMKLVSGSSLKTLLTNAASLEERLALLPNVIAAADTIAFAHQRAILHRDIKPSNVLVATSGETVVIDWGLAKDMDEAPITMSNPHAALGGCFDVVLGTPAYMAPEQACGAPVDERADVHALGAMLYHLAAGLPPFPCAGVLPAPLREAAVPVLEREPRLPRALATIIARAMAPRPSDRQPSARAFSEDLTRFVKLTQGPLSCPATPPRSWSLAG